jgi:hypothetical protein
MFKLKSIHREGIPRALEKVERYRLLNEPVEAESICRDILDSDPNNQEALVLLILSLTDQFHSGISGQDPLKLIQAIKDEYKKEYYKGIILERKAKAALYRNTPGSNHDVFEWLEEAMAAFEKAGKISPAGNDDAILRWNACVRTIQRHNLTPRPQEEPGHMNISLE